MPVEYMKTENSQSKGIVKVKINASDLSLIHISLQKHLARMMRLISQNLVLRIPELSGNIPVSYTHLDVYKRQDPVLGSWYAVDDLSEHYYYLSPYNYCMDNPANWVGPNGREPEITVDLL